MNHLDLSPPYSVEAEQGVLGGLLLDNNTWDLVADKLDASDFFRHDHRLLFRAIAGLADKSAPFDIVIVFNALEDPDEAGGLSYLGELAKNTPSVANIEHYASIVRNRSRLRQLMSLGYQCSRDATDPLANAEDVQEAIEQQLFALGEGKSASEFVNINQCLTTVVEKIDEHFNGNVTVTGVPSGLDDLDEMTSGFQNADLIILGARPSMGKTSLALNFVDKALQAQLDRTVQIFSMEMPAEAMLYRLMAIVGHLDLGKLLKGKLDEDDWPKLSAAVSRIDGYGERLVIDDSSGLTPTAIRAKSRRAARRFGRPSLDRKSVV